MLIDSTTLRLLYLETDRWRSYRLVAWMTGSGRVRTTDRAGRTAGHCRVADVRDVPCDGSFLAGWES